MRRYRYHSWLVVLLIISSSGCSTGRFVDYGEGYSSKKTTSSSPYKEKQPRNTTVAYHVVSKGDTLYSIAWQYGYDFRTIARWNHVKAPYTIYPGQKLRVRQPTTTSSNAKKITKKSQTGKKSSASRRNKPVKSGKSNNKNVTWRWPTQGKVVSHFAAGDLTRQGIDIGGRKGQPIYAAAPGRVVYSGNGLRGYGNLVIIKHNETYFSAYAHNDKVLVKENENVKSGQRIADMGKSGANKIMLHFEIRRNGKPANPLKYLPKKRS